MRDGMPHNHPSLPNTKRKLLKLDFFNVSMQDLGCYYSCGEKFNKDVLVEATKICLLLPKEEASGILHLFRQYCVVVAYSLVCFMLKYGAWNPFEITIEVVETWEHFTCFCIFW